jgi:AraC-like DNA-binding protein
MDFGRIDPVVRIFWEGRSVPPWHEPLRRIYDCELVYTSDGEFTLAIAEKSWRMTSGSIAIVPPATWHESSLGRSGHAMRHCIHFDWNRDFEGRPAPLMSFANEVFDESRVHAPPTDVAMKLPLVIPPDRTGPVLPILRMALDAFRSRGPAGDALLWPVLKLLVAADERTPARSVASGKTEKAVLTLKHHIETHYSSPLGYTDFAALTHLSRGHLCQAFSRIIGCPPTAYLNRIRLQHAQRLLLQPSMNVAEVGRAVGIPDANYFARLFRKHSGMSPTAFLARALGT